MGLQYQFKKAQATLNRLSSYDREKLEKICDDLQQAEKRLRVAAADALAQCGTSCQGVCCRNIDMDAVLGIPDFVYILTMRNHLADQMAACLQNESALFITDCVFLENGTGPCIFPHTVMPEVCITTFCTTETPAKEEIRSVKWKFFQLGWFLGTLKIRGFARYLLGWVKKADHRISQ